MFRAALQLCNVRVGGETGGPTVLSHSHTVGLETGKLSSRADQSPVTVSVWPIPC